MNNHIGHLERVLAFTVEVLKQDIGKNSPNRVSFYEQKLVWIGGKIEGALS